jgi:hypothetical protein
VSVDCAGSGTDVTAAFAAAGASEAGESDDVETGAASSVAIRIADVDRAEIARFVTGAAWTADASRTVADFCTAEV